MFHDLIRKIIKWLDPKLEKYRQKPDIKPSKYTPKNLEDFIDILRRTPRNILNQQDRNRIAAIMSFNERHVKDLMAPKSQTPFVSNKEVLGPLVLDKLYQSGFTQFPVTDGRGKVIGIIHTEALNTLEIKKTDRASKYLDPAVYYLHDTDSLQFAIEEIERTGSSYFLVLDTSDQTIGCFTTQILLDYLLG